MTDENPHLPEVGHDLLRRAKSEHAKRRSRDMAFGDHADLFGNPAWDVLIHLLIAHLEARPVSISKAYAATCASPTTAARWVNILEKRGLILRRADPTDKRRFFVAITPKGTIMVERAIR